MALEFRKVLLSTPGNVICEQKTYPPRKSVKSFVLYVSLRRKSKAYNTKSKFEQFLVFSYLIHKSVKIYFILVFAFEYCSENQIQPGKANLTGPEYIGWITNRS